MADLKLDLNWDLEDGKIVFYVSSGDAELAQLVLDQETILESFQADVDDLEFADSQVSPEDWTDFAESLQDISEAIFDTLATRNIRYAR